MKDTPVLQNLYTRVDILDFDKSNETFVKIASIYMIGDASKYVKSIDDFNIKNKQLVAAMGISAVKELTVSKSVSGGDDEWDELDDMDFEEILNTDSVKIVDSLESTNVKSQISGNHFTNFTLFETDKASDVCEKIAMTTKIEPYKQYIWIPSEQKSITGNEISLMSYWTTSLRKIEGFPIDGRRVDIDNGTQLPLKAFCRSSTVVLTCVCLDSLVKDKSRIQFIARSDSESYELIHANAIHQFFPLVTLPVFNHYLMDENSIGSKYETCYFNFKETNNRYISQTALIKDLNTQKKITIDSSDLLTVTTTGMDILASYGDNSIRVDTNNIFQSINSSDLHMIAFIDFYCLDDDMRSVRLRKVQQRDQFRLNKEEPLLTIGSYTKKKLIQSKSIIFTLLPQNEFDLVKLIIDRYGTILIRMQPNQTKSYSKKAFVEYISKIVDPIIHTINSIDTAFTSHERFPKIRDKVGQQYQYPSSSSKLSFRFPLSYNKLLDLTINKLVSSGFVTSINSQEGKRNNPIISFGICYGVSKDQITGYRRSSIDIRSVSGMAIIVLSNLDVEETSLYVDIIGRLIKFYKSQLSIPSSEQAQLSVVDPVLFRTKVSSDGYSRICQKKFQPVVSTANDPKSVKYHNFTFERPEYYSCPTKNAPVLGFILGKHESGYCLPCCRKMPQVDEKKVRESCIANESVETSKLSTYKIDYPIIDVPNHKIMNRRISMPAYITQLLSIPSAVANGTILSSHGGIRDGLNPATKSYLQTSLIISAIESSSTMKPIYESNRELILDIIAMIKQPLMQVNIMKNKVISTRFTTPQALIHAIEDYYIRDKILDINANLSSVEWNDLIIFLSNCMGLNVLLMADERIKSTGIQLINIHDIDVSKPVTILLRRTNVEWSLRQHNTRALYLPITSSAFKVLKISSLIIPRFKISKSLSKIKRITSGSIVNIVSKQLTLERLSEVVKYNKKYKIIEEISDQKLVVLRLGTGVLISTIYTLTTNIKPKNINVTPTTSLKDLCLFITEYNTHFMNETENINEELKSYKSYLTVALKTDMNYQFIKTKTFLLKIHRFILHDSMVIGVILNLVDVDKVVSRELMFIKASSMKSIQSELSKLHSDLRSLHDRINVRAIVAYPITTEVLFNSIDNNHKYSSDHAFITWLNHPLKSSNIQPNGCKEDMKTAYNKGAYNSEIYNLLVSDLVKAWQNTQDDTVVELVSQMIKSSKHIPIATTKIDKLILDIESKCNHDPIIIRIAMMDLFNQINAIDKSVSEATTRLKHSTLFMGFGLKNIHRLNKSEIRTRVIKSMKDLTVKATTYPSFDMNISVKNQRKQFYDTKAEKLLIHTTLYDDIIDMLVADLSNPFRRDYLVNLQLIDSSLTDMRPHLGELIYVQQIKS